QILADRRRFFRFGADDDWAFINRLLDSVGLWDFEYAGHDEFKEGYSASSYIWINDSVSGIVYFTNLGNRPAFDLARTSIDVKERKDSCGKGFDYKLREVEMASGAKAWRLFASCSIEGTPLVFTDLFFVYEGTGVIVSNAGPADDIDAVRDADNRLSAGFRRPSRWNSMPPPRLACRRGLYRVAE
ncbi:MAG: hypothetical protein O7A03_01180, partial [Alphaproteobacteria bacterium]|nr:hypothetical protein [Alphaproteobacteria bacterium]